MPSNNARLVVEVVADSATFQADLGKAADVAQHSAKRMQDSFGEVRRLLGDLGVALSIGGIAEWGKGIIQASEDLHNLSQETGSSVENLSRLANQAKISGTPFQDLRVAVERLAAGMGGTEDGTTKTADALRFLGVSTRDPAQAIQDIALKLDKFSDGAGKAAIARDLFGRGGVQFLATLHNIAETQGQVNTVTKEQAEAATRLAESYRTLVVNSNQLRDAFLNAVVPAISDVIAKFNAARTAGDGFFEGLKSFAHLNPFGSASDDIASLTKQIADLDTRIETLRAKPPAKFLGLFDTHANDPTNLIAERAGLQRSLEIARSVDAKQNPVGPPESLATKPKLAYASTTGNGTADDPAKKILEGQIKAIEASIEEEKSVLGARNEFLSQYFGAGLISVNDFFKGQRDAIQESVEFQRKAYAEEIADLQAYVQKANVTEVNRQDAKNKIIDVTKKLQLAEQEAAKASTLNWFEEQRAAEIYRHSVDSIAAQVLSLRGNTAGATAITAKDQFEDQRRVAVNSGDTQTVSGIDEIIRRSTEQAALNDATQKYGTILERLSISQQRIDLEAVTGSITEIDALNRKAQLANAYIPVLEKELQTQQALVDALADGPVKDAAIAQLERYKLAIDELAASTDALAKKFNDSFAGPVADGLTAIATGTKSVKDAFKDIIKGIDQNISQIASKNIADALFGKSGPLGGVGGFFAGLFGGKGAASATGEIPGINPSGGTIGDIFKGGSGGSGGFDNPFLAGFGIPSLGGAGDAAGTAALSAAGASLTGAGTLLTTGGTTLTTAATLLTTAATTLQSAAASLAASSGASGASGLGSLFGGGGGSPIDVGDNFAGGIPFFADGTNSAPGGFAVVGERGPELVNLPQGAQVIPNNVVKLHQQKGSIFDLLKIPRFASGTNSAPGGLAMVGEVGPELVRMPTPVMPNNVVNGNFSGKSTTVHQTNNITVAGNTTSKTADQIAVEIGRRTQRAISRNG